MVEMESASELEAGDPVPSFELPGADGETYRVEDFADAEALLAVVTCNHCPYAIAKIPALNALAEEYDDDSFERMREVVEDGTVRYDAYLRDESQDVARAFGATCTPDPFLFGRSNGGFELAYHGRLDDAMNPDEEPTGDPGFEMREHIESVLAGEPVEGEWQPSRGCSIKWKD